MYTVKEIVAKSIILLVVENIFVVGISALLFTFSLNNGFIVAVNLILYALCFVLGNVTGYSRSVSYTHLDVYKRQLPFIQRTSKYQGWNKVRGNTY